MGHFFHNMLVEAVTPEVLAQGLVEAFGSLGYYVPADDEGADCVFEVYGRTGDRFLALVGDWSDNGADNLAEHIAKAVNGRVIGVQCVDSDVLILSLTEGDKTSVAYVGSPEAYGITPRPLRAAPWEALVGDDWPAFRSALDASYTFAEDALNPLGAIIGFSAADAARCSDDPGQPLQTYAFKRQQPIPEYLPDQLRPAFRRIGYWREQDVPTAAFLSAGGHGQGVEVLIVAPGVDAGTLDGAGIRLARAFNLQRERNDIEARLESIPLEGGGVGWLAEFPDAEILSGPNPDHPQAHRPDGLDRNMRRTYYVFLTERKGFTLKPPGEPVSEGDPLVHVQIMPVGNRSGWAAVSTALSRAD
ncbi:MAG: hypothetical protein VB115_02195 [Christensenellaceae bacterium]|nr:hypothetical protein [Christensenellaceae bacterium]